MSHYRPFAREVSIHSVVDATAKSDPAVLDAFIAGLSPNQAALLPYDWDFWARDEQLPPEGDWSTWLYLAGRGAGKSRAGAEWVLRKVREGTNVIHLIAPTEADYRDVMIHGESGILSVAPPWERPRFIATARRLEFPNGAYALCFSAEQPERLRGPQCEAAWCDEVAAWRYPDQTWDMMSFGLRVGSRPQVMISTTPKPIPLIKRLVADPNTAVTRGSTYDNRANLAPSFFDKIIRRYEGTRLGRQELLAELLTDNPDALFSYAKIDELRCGRDRVPTFNRIVVAVDPPASSGEDADECGIIVAGLGDNEHGYVLADYSTQGQTPNEWAKAALRAYFIYNADALIVEINQGGDMVRDVIENANRALPPDRRIHGLRLREVRAFRGKRLRAEPVAALYEQGRVHHVGTFGALEDEMCDYTIDFDRSTPRRRGDQRQSTSSAGNRSPDRLDAMVYAITDLMLHQEQPVTVGRMRIF